MSMDDQLASEPAAAADPSAVLHAISWCLHALARGYGLDPRERQAALALLSAGIPGVDATDSQAAGKIIRSQRRLTSRERDRASDLSIRFAEQAEQTESRCPLSG